MRTVKRLKVDNARTRALTEAEQRAVLEAAPRKLRALVALALITRARVGELLALQWEHCDDGALTFLETKNGRMRRIPISPAIQTVLDSLPRVHTWVFTNAVTQAPYTVNGCAHVFRRAVRRAGLSKPREVTLHTLRHTAVSRMIALGHDDFLVMALSGHRSTRMLARYAHPSESPKIAALTLPAVGTKRSQSDRQPDLADQETRDLADLLRESGGRQEARTPDLRVANATGARR